MNTAARNGLSGVEGTLLIPLMGRALEGQRAYGLFRDARAEALAQELGVDPKPYASDEAAMAGVAVRTRVLDDAVRAYLQDHPNALVLNLAAGLDTRFERVDTGQCLWVEVDLPAAAALRERLLPPDNPRHLVVAGSVLEADWLKALPARGDRPLLVIAEGLLYYFKEKHIRTLAEALAGLGGPALWLWESPSPFVAAMAPVLSVVMPALRPTGAKLDGGLSHPRAPEAWVPGLRWRESWPLVAQHPQRWGWRAMGGLLPPFRDLVAVHAYELPAAPQA